MHRRGLRLAFDKPGEHDDPILPTKYPEAQLEYEPPTRDWLYNFTRMVASTKPRKIDSVEEVHWAACRRAHELRKWRPEAIRLIEKEVMKVDWRVLKRRKEEGVEKKGKIKEKDEGEREREREEKQ